MGHTKLRAEKVGHLDTLTFRDDDREGFEFRVLRSADGDMWLSMRPNREDIKAKSLDEEEIHSYDNLYGATVRVRVPMVGGGDHPELWHALAALFKKAGA